MRFSQNNTAIGLWYHRAISIINLSIHNSWLLRMCIFGCPRPKLDMHSNNFGKSFRTERGNNMRLKQTMQYVTDKVAQCW